MQDLARRFKGFELRLSARNVKGRRSEMPPEAPARLFYGDAASRRVIVTMPRAQSSAPAGDCSSTTR
jgi:hypothetical protein